MQELITKKESLLRVRKCPHPPPKKNNNKKKKKQNPSSSTAKKKKISKTSRKDEYCWDLKMNDMINARDDNFVKKCIFKKNINKTKIHPVHTSRMRHKIIFLADFNRFEFRVFFLLDNDILKTL